ncbi:MAG: hypothetical protein II951_02250 [Bacteroidales bacterium]|nr:hypothetical protein [Bacteroidales bacterium]
MYGEENLFKNDQRERTIANFDSILVANEDISQYEIEQKADVISSLNKDNNLSVEARAQLLQAMIDANGATQWIWNGTTLVHEFYTDISNKTGRLIKSKNRIAVDMTPIGREYYEVTVYSRQNSEDSAKKIAEGIWGKFMPWRNDNKTRHLYKKIAWNTDNREIAAIMSNLLQEIRRYRDRMITNN